MRDCSRLREKMVDVRIARGVHDWRVPGGPTGLSDHAAWRVLDAFWPCNLHCPPASPVARQPPASLIAARRFQRRARNPAQCLQSSGGLASRYIACFCVNYYWLKPGGRTLQAWAFHEREFAAHGLLLARLPTGKLAAFRMAPAAMALSTIPFKECHAGAQSARVDARCADRTGATGFCEDLALDSLRDFPGLEALDEGGAIEGEESVETALDDLLGLSENEGRMPPPVRE